MRWQAVLRLFGAIAVLVGCGFLVLQACSPEPARAKPLSDGQSVFCLDKERQKDVVAAAAALGLALPGDEPGTVVSGTSEIPLTVWRTTRRKDFERTCRALLSAAQEIVTPVSEKKPGELRAQLISLLPVAAGGAIAWFAATRQARAAAGALLGAALHTTTVAYRQAGESHVGAWTQDPLDGTPTEDVLVERSTALALEFDRCIRARPRWNVIRALSDEFAELRRQNSTACWAALVARERADHGRLLLDRQARFCAMVADLGTVIERPWLLHRVVWARRTRDVTGPSGT